VNEDCSDLEGPSVEGGFFQEGHHGHDGVLAAEIVVEPKFVNEAFAVFLQELDAFSAGAGNPRSPGEWTEVVYAKDDGRRCDYLFSHLILITAKPRENLGGCLLDGYSGYWDALGACRISASLSDGDAVTCCSPSCLRQ
jgi:hypothetical protein